MKKILLFAVAALMGFGVFAAESFWKTDFKAAAKIAQTKKLPMLLLFTGPDWCPHCVYLEKNVVSTAEFKKFATEKAVAVYLEFPRYKKLSAALAKQNGELAEKYRIEGYPTLVVLSPDGKTLGEVSGARRDAAQYIGEIKQLLSGKK